MKTTATWSEFLRDPNGVLAAMEQSGEVVLVRRSAPALRLSDDRAASATEETLAALTQLLAIAMDDTLLEQLAGRLTLVFPWIELLPASARLEFVAEFLNTARGGLSVGNLDRLTIVLGAWRDTAAAYADPNIEVDGTDLDRLPEPEPAPDPRATS
ncbi:hypothetical protein [Nocardia sp. NPDC048505]|uniref:hypothetical protein n=1 Tax=unclassified Nocardia TaxID=2637762 RepID=UPI0033D6E05F